MKKALKRMAAAALVTLSVLRGGDAFAQNAVDGRVVDANGAPLVGVTVLIKGTQSGTATGANGSYSIKAREDQTLVFSYLGYTTVEEYVGKRTAINVKMTEEASQIGAVEIVNIGYGTTTRRDLTGSVAKADLGTMMKANVTNFDQALGGRIAGVVVTTGDGSLGAEANITIRGNNSLTQSNAPLYIIDGFPSEGSFAASINPADIESIDVLKDASATAIYGARGANGVIVINTKRGNEGKPTVNFSASFSLNKIANKADLMDSYEFVRLQSELISEETMNKSYFSEGLTLDDYRHIPGIDWQDQLYRTAFQQNYNVSLSGGNKEGLRYNVGFSALDQDGIIIRSNFQRYQGKANFTLPISKKLTLNANANYSRTATNGVTPTTAQTTSSSSGWLMYSVWGYRPVTPPGQDILDSMLDEAVDGSNDYRFNPVKTAKNEYRKTLVDYLNANLALTWKITPDLTFKTTGGYVRSDKQLQVADTEFLHYSITLRLRKFTVQRQGHQRRHLLDRPDELVERKHAQLQEAPGAQPQPRPDGGTLAPGAEEHLRRRCVDADHLRGAGHRGHPHRQLPEGPEQLLRLADDVGLPAHQLQFPLQILPDLLIPRRRLVEIPLRQPLGLLPLDRPFVELQPRESAEEERVDEQRQAAPLVGPDG